MLSIRVRREQREEIKDDSSFGSEFHYGSCRRTMMLPAGADAEDVKAEYHDGLFEVRVPIDSERSARTKVPMSR